jgi:ABC-type uncharacterized transport system substrate-binding protein
MRAIFAISGDAWDDLHEIFNGANPRDISIYLPVKYELVINLKAAKAIGQTAVAWSVSKLSMNSPMWRGASSA